MDNAKVSTQKKESHRRVGSSVLTAGAIMCAPPGEKDSPEPTRAATAGFPFASINLQAILEQSFKPEAVPEVAHRRPLEVDRFFKDPGDSGPESFQAPAAQAGDIGPGMKLGFVKDFVGIDIADTREHPLVEEEILEPAAPAPEPLEENLPVQVQRFRTEKAKLPGPFRIRRPHNPDEPELADIPVAEFPRGTFETQNEMRVLVERGVPDAEDELAGHLEMDDESQSAGEIHQDHLAATAQAADPTTDELLERETARVPDNRRGQQKDAPDPEVAEKRTEAADDRFDFRELGHPLIILDLPFRFLYDS